MAKYSKGAQKAVKSAVKRMEKGTLRSGRSNKKVTNPKQAVAIGLSEAREKGAKVPRKKVAPKKTVKRSAPTKTAKSSTVKKAAVKKAAPKKKAVPSKKVTAKKKAPVKKAVAKKTKKVASREEEIRIPVAASETINTNLPPVEESSPQIVPVLPEKIEDPVMAIDKRVLAKAVTKHDPRHPMQLSRVKSSIRPSGKKPLWR